MPCSPPRACGGSGETTTCTTEAPAAKPSLYGVLGVSIKATAEEIRLSYRRLARLWHPDRHFGDEGAKRKFQQVQCAYEVLSNPSRRQHYDLQWLDLLDVEDYLSRFSDFILTANGLGMSLSASEQQQHGGGGAVGGAVAGAGGPSAEPRHLGASRGWQAWCHTSLTAA